MVKVLESGPHSRETDGYVYKPADKALHPIPCRIDPGDLLINFNGLYIVGTCKPEDKLVLAHQLFFSLRERRKRIQEVLEVNSQGDC